MKFLRTLFLLGLMILVTASYSIAGDREIVYKDYGPLYRGPSVKKGNGWQSPDFKGYKDSEVNPDWVRGGFYIRTYKVKKFIRGRWMTSYQYEINLTCFHVSRHSSPCDRGSFRKNGKGRTLPYPTWFRMPNHRVRGRHILKKP